MNAIAKAYNEEFLIQLEYHVGAVLANCADINLRGFWCDGIEFDQYSKKYINDHRAIVTTAYIGKDGQDKYEMTLNFGKYSLRRIARYSDLSECLPDVNDTAWIDIDPNARVIELFLK